MLYYALIFLLIALVAGARLCSFSGSVRMDSTAVLPIVFDIIHRFLGATKEALTAAINLQ